MQGNPKWTILDLEVIKYYKFFNKDNICTRTMRYGKAESTEAMLGSSWGNISKAQGQITVGRK